MRYSMRDGEVHWEEEPTARPSTRPEGGKSAVDGLQKEISGMRQRISGLFDAAKGNPDKSGRDAA